MGQTISVIRNRKTESYQVSGIFHDLPNNTHLSFDAITLVRDEIWPTRRFQQSQPNAYTYVKVREGINIPLFLEEFDAFSRTAIPPFRAGRETYNILQPMVGLQYRSDPSFNQMRQPIDRQYVVGLTVISIALLFSAGYNFVILFSALNSMRARELAMRRVHGVGPKALAKVALIEGILVGSTACLLSVEIANTISPIIMDFTKIEIPLSGPGRVPLQIGYVILAVLLGVFSNLLSLTNFLRKPLISNLRDNQAGSVGNKGRTHQMLVGAQAFVFVAVIFSACQIAYQIYHLRTFDRGFEFDGLAFIEAPLQVRVVSAQTKEGDDPQNNPVWGFFKNNFRLKALDVPGVEQAALTGLRPFNPLRLGARFQMPRGGNEPTTILLAGPDYIDLVKIDVLAAIDGDWQAFQRPVAIEEEYLSVFGLMGRKTSSEITDYSEILGYKLIGATGDDTEEYTVVAVIPSQKDGVPTDRLHLYDVSEVAFSALPIAIKFDAEKRVQVEAALETAFLELFPDASFQISYSKDTFEETLKVEKDSSLAVLVLSLIIAVLGSAGLYGMASNWLAARARELAIRRVFGASNAIVIKFALRKMLLPVFAGGTIGFIPAWYIMRNWLSQFTEQAALPIYAFPSLLLSALLLASMVLVFHTILALKKRPVSILYYE